MYKCLARMPPRAFLRFTFYAFRRIVFFFFFFWFVKKKRNIKVVKKCTKGNPQQSDCLMFDVQHTDEIVKLYVSSQLNKSDKVSIYCWSKCGTTCTCWYCAW